MDEILTPDIVLSLGPGLDGAARAEFSPAVPAREPEALLLLHSMNPFEIHRPATALEKAPC